MTSPTHRTVTTVGGASVASNLERAREITGRSKDELTGVVAQISQVVAKQLSDKK